MSNKKIENIIEEEIKDLRSGWVATLETERKSFLDATFLTIKKLTDIGYKGIIVSAYWSADRLLNLYEEMDVNTDNIYIIDCVPHPIDMSQNNNIIHIAARSALGDIKDAVNEAMKNLDGNKFVFIDSITTMIIYNNPEDFERFIHDTLTSIRLSSDTGGILFAIEKEVRDDIRSEIVQLCDKVIKI